VWPETPYLCLYLAAFSPVRRSLGTLTGGVASLMGSGDQSQRLLERRWAPRYPFRIGLEIEWGSAVLRAQTINISANGMFIESTDPLWIGAGFTARLSLEQPLQLDCFVRRVEPGRGMGVTVTLSQESHQRRYKDLLNSLSTTQP
jgi:PilZ domain